MADPAHTSHDTLPPEPAVRSISPAPEDYASPPPMSRLLWPLFWTGAAILLYAVVSTLGWPAFEAHH